MGDYWPECENLLYFLDMSSKVYRMNYFGNSDNNEWLNWYEKFKRKEFDMKIGIKMIWKLIDLKIDMKIDPDNLIQTLWSRHFDPDTLIQTNWSRQFDPDNLIQTIWSR